MRQRPKQRGRRSINPSAAAFRAVGNGRDRFRYGRQARIPTRTRACSPGVPDQDGLATTTDCVGNPLGAPSCTRQISWDRRVALGIWRATGWVCSSPSGCGSRGHEQPRPLAGAIMRQPFRLRSQPHPVAIFILIPVSIPSSQFPFVFVFVFSEAPAER
jgi:hypothetical protein